MPSLNMTNNAQILKFYKKIINRGNFYLSSTVLKFGDLLGGWKLATNVKFQLNYMPIRPKIIYGHGV